MCAANHMAVYLMAIYLDEADRDKFFKAYEATGKRLDVGKSCVRFRRLDDLPLELIGRAIASMSPKMFVAKVKALRTPKH